MHVVGAIRIQERSICSVSFSRTQATNYRPEKAGTGRSRTEAAISSKRAPPLLPVVSFKVPPSHLDGLDPTGRNFSLNDIARVSGYSVMGFRVTRP